MTLGLDIFHIINVEYRKIRSCTYIARGAPCVVHSLLQPPPPQRCIKALAKQLVMQIGERSAFCMSKRIRPRASIQWISEEEINEMYDSPRPLGPQCPPGETPLLWGDIATERAML